MSIYEFRVDGHVDEHWATQLGGLRPDHHGDGSTTLTGPVADQAELHGLLARLRDLGTTLLSVRAVPEPAAALRKLDWPARTERLVLRPGTADDADAVFAYRRLEQVARWITELPVDEDVFRTRFATPQRLADTLIVEHDGRVIGDLMLRVEDAWAQAEVADGGRGVQAELGWVFDPAQQGHGYATEAVRELLRICFDGLGLRRVSALCFADNEPSWRLMERVGMRREEHNVRESLHRSGEWLDGFGYALLADEWKAAAGVQDSGA
ncbi:GNAT family N-acetyltransferase [Jiangella mangrovi]|uniref:RimJ/RimL family protein N-acetyltransferase n=1 Tax=Jiangella mangrovi TaxID=1524084 RepID=A0A7W9GUW7_9ACTN|nr:GNAT family protein [Jiangella mangrovi]MBB5790223.1 RimJ/RimL family protein N-acetyltransferase [Jiangella mangrovi]